MDLSGMTAMDWAGLVAFAIGWLAYEPVLSVVTRQGGSINGHMQVVRRAWMAAMTVRENRLLDSQLMGHSINSASFFASANLLLIAAVGGFLIGGRSVTELVGDAPVAEALRSLVEAKLALVIVCLVRGFLDFTWSIRQMNYTLALIGATPEAEQAEAARAAFAEAAERVLNPALTAFSRGVRGYYFALAAAAWMFGGVALLAASLAVLALLIWRQGFSAAAQGIRGSAVHIDGAAHK
ncbi:DUF599 family protein [Brevundimonas sp. 2R-24]|uniref:DUF599 family protein n=1 Tax=Peiella sedimenti TaxID=3061083 RepID=A0ABT8SH21_9CAUL|nr:DUF599 family protein [Caulobacteraceae bacterium XZ-24]